MTKQGKERINFFFTRPVTVFQFMENNDTMYGHSALNKRISGLGAKQGQAWLILGWENCVLMGNWNLVWLSQIYNSRHHLAVF